MLNSSKQRNNKLQIRVDKLTKEKIEKAASYSNKTISDFVLENVVPMAEKVIEEHLAIKLSSRDWDKLMAQLENPPEANRALKQAAKHYKAVVWHK